MMINQLHNGLTENPKATLLDGSQEIGIRELFTSGHTLGTIGAQLAFKRTRAKLAKMQTEKRWTLPDRTSEPLLKELLEIISMKKRAGTVASVLAPWHEDPTLSKSEGYLRRIVEIDKRVLSNCFCIYFYECPYYRVDHIVADKISDNRIYIRYNANYDAQRSFVETLIYACDVCYSHSVLRIVPCEEPERQERWLNIFSGNVRHILDVHGAVVEESKLRVRETGQAETANVAYCQKAENLYFHHADAIIVLSQAMRRYFSEQYKCWNTPFFSTPVLSEDIFCDDETSWDKRGLISIVYAGGCQPWQNIPDMQYAIKCQPELGAYHLFISEPDVFMNLWGTEPLPPNIIMKTAHPSEIREVYLKAHYGFILRDDNIVNRVASPTKIMEYLQFGIVPVVKFSEIGDFKSLGLQYLPVEKFNEGQLPSEKERQEMAKINASIIWKQKQEYTNVIKSIKEFIKELSKQKGPV